MAPINGRPFLEHQLNYWIDQGIDHFVLSLGYRHEVISNHFGNTYRSARIDYAIETSPLGTGGGMLLGSSCIGNNDSFLLLNGDTYFAVDLKKLIDFSVAHSSDWCFSLFRAREDDRYMGLDVGQDGHINSLKSGSLCKIGGLANGGAYWVNGKSLKHINWPDNTKSSLEDDFLPFVAASGQCLVGLEFPGTFIDIGVPNDFRRAQHLAVFTN
jgi:D-glycero-alpha-D-manno-heptose 1-phosphate guanylyltransferase